MTSSVGILSLNWMVTNLLTSLQVTVSFTETRDRTCDSPINSTGNSRDSIFQPSGVASHSLHTPSISHERDNQDEKEGCITFDR